jgi:hypothetical protein
MHQYTVADANRQTHGPLPEETVRQWLMEGRIHLDSLAWRPGMAEWQPLRSFSEFIDVPNDIAAPSLANPYAAPQSSLVLPIHPDDGVDLNIPSAERARRLVELVKQRGYQIDIFNCIGRGWNLVFSRHFWDIVGVHFVTWIAMAAAGMCYAGIVVNGPILGGFDRYLLQKIRGRESNLDTAFSGFKLAFSQLFLVYIVTLLLGGIGFLCCVIPGIYLMVCWIFAKTLVVDQRLEFWDAMEASRKIVHQNWFSIFGLVFIGGLVAGLGVLGLLVGVFVTMPVFYASMMYAYEDIIHPPSLAGQL